MSFDTSNYQPTYCQPWFRQTLARQYVAPQETSICSMHLTYRTVDFSNLDQIALYGAVGLTISTFAITLSKISFGVTLIRLTDGWLRYYVFFTMTTLAVFAIPTAVLPWTLCKPLSKTFVDILPGTCVDKQPSVHYARFQAGKSDMTRHLTRGLPDNSKYGLRSWISLLHLFPGRFCGGFRCG